MDVRAHAGKNLSAGIDSTTVYGDVALQNLDGYLGKDSNGNELGYGGLTVTTDIVAKEGNNNETGSITFQQQGDILVEGALQADGSVTETGYQVVQGDPDEIIGAGSVVNKKSILAGTDVTLGTGSGQIHTMGTVTAVTGDVKVKSLYFDDPTSGNQPSGDQPLGKIQLSEDVSAGKDIQIGALAGAVTAEKQLSAGRDIAIETLTGNVTIHSAHAGDDIEITSGNNSAGSGNISVTGSMSAIGNVTVATTYTGTNTAQGNISLGKIPVDPLDIVSAGEDITLRTATGSIYGGSFVTSTYGSVVAETNKGDVGFLGGVYAAGEINTKITNEGNIIYTNVHSAGTAAVTDAEGNPKDTINITAETEKGVLSLGTSSQIPASSKRIKAV